MGAASGLVAAPCGAPAFAAVLTFVAATGSAVLGFVYLFVFSLGLTALLVAVGLSSGLLAALPAAGRWTRLGQARRRRAAPAHGRVLLRPHGERAVRAYRAGRWVCSPRCWSAPSRGAGDRARGRGTAPRRSPSTTSTGSRWTSAQYLGKQPLFLEWWATWCEQCDALLPRVRAAQAEVGDRVQFLGINVAVNQSPERVRRYVESNDVPFRTLYDDEGASTRAYAAPTTSYVVIVDRAGEVAYTGTGGDQDFLGALRRVAAP